ncbi:hypothetical protein [Saccharopolyspora halophila]|uniref:hypothetical protein n=1 Tax=Saccharopolyspora halophila TaxID=405551 RepID=UPI0031DE6153
MSVAEVPVRLVISLALRGVVNMWQRRSHGSPERSTSTRTSVRELSCPVIDFVFSRSMRNYVPRHDSVRFPKVCRSSPPIMTAMSTLVSDFAALLAPDPGNDERVSR